MKASLGTAFPAAYGQTDRGLLRKRNEDNFLCDNTHRVYAVADGLGGLPQGDMASRIAIEGLKKTLENAQPGIPLDWTTLFRKFSQQVFEAGHAQNDSEVNIGTTLTAVQVLAGRKLHIGHVGDSGVFHFTRLKNTLLTTDHTMAQEEISRHGPGIVDELPDYYRHTLTRCLGQPNPLQVDVLDITVHKGDRVLLYTDGVTKTCSPLHLHGSVFLAETPQQYVAELIRYGNKQGGPDNITAIALFF